MVDTTLYCGADGCCRPLNLYFPTDWKAGDRRGLVVLFFGGGWQNGTPKQFAPHALEFARLGMVAAVPEYRTVESHGTPVEAAVLDAIHSVAHLSEYAEMYGVDRRRIVLGGGSAGGHLALATVLNSNLTPFGASYLEGLRGLMLCNPVLDLAEVYDRFLALRLSQYPQEHFSPSHALRTGMPDQIIFHGTADTTIPFAASQRYTQRCTALGNRVELVPYAGKDHGFFNCRPGQYLDYYDVLGRMVQFLSQHQMFEYTAF